MADTPPSPLRRTVTLVELGLVALAALFSIWFYATKPSRLPRQAEYEQAVKAIREGLQTGDAVAVLPAWADRVRGMLPGVPFLAVPDLAKADLSRVRRLWLLELPSLPRAEVANREREATATLKADGEAQKFGRVELKRFTNPGFHEPRFDFTEEVGRAQVYLDIPGRRIDCALDGTLHRCGRGPTVGHEWREIDFAPQRCVGANPVGRGIPLVVEYPDALLSGKLDVLAAVTGEMAWRHTPGLTPVDLAVAIDGQPVAQLTVPVGTVPPQKLAIDTSRFDPAQPHDVRFAVTTSNPQDREFCFDAQAE